MPLLKRLLSILLIGSQCLSLYSQETTYRLDDYFRARRSKSDGTWAVLKNNGKVKIDNLLNLGWTGDSIPTFRSGYIPAQNNKGQYLLYDDRFSVVYSGDYQVQDILQDLVLFHNQSKFAIGDKKGNLLTPFVDSIRQISPVSYLISDAKLKRKRLYNRSQDYDTSLKVDSAYQLNPWYTIIIRNQKSGVVNFTNQVVVPTQYKGIEAGKFGLAISDLDVTLLPYSTFFYSLDGVQIADSIPADSINIYSNGTKILHRNQAQYLYRRGQSSLPITGRKIIDYDSYYIIERVENGSILRDKEFMAVFPFPLKKIARHRFNVVYIEFESAKSGWFSYPNFEPLNLNFDSVLWWADDHFAIRENNKTTIYDSTFQKLTLDLSTYQDIQPIVEDELVVQQDGKYGLLNLAGDQLLAFVFDSLEILRKDAYSYVYNHQRGLINSSGLELYRTSGDTLVNGYDYGLVLSANLYKGLTDLEGNLLARVEFDSISFQDPHFYLYKNGFQYYTLPGSDTLELNGEHQKFSKWVWPAYKDKTVVVRENLHGMANYQGIVTVTPYYEDLRPYAFDRSAFKYKGKWGFLNQNGQLLIQPYYDSVQTFRQEDRTVVGIGEKFGMISNEGKELLSIDYDSIQFDSGYWYVYADGLVGVYSEDFDQGFYPRYKKVNPTPDGKVITTDGNGLQGLDYLSGQTIQFPKYHDILRVNRSSNYFFKSINKPWTRSAAYLSR